MQVVTGKYVTGSLGDNGSESKVIVYSLWFKALDYVGLYKYFKDLDSMLSNR